MEDRAERPTGFIPWLGAAFAAFRAEAPSPPQEIREPHGLFEMAPLLAEVRSAGGPGPPTIRRDAAGTSLLLATEWARAAGVRPAAGVLGGLLASETGDIDAKALAIGESVVCAARAIKHDDETIEDAIIRRIVGDKRPAFDGRFAKQGGRWASTAQQPALRHLALAEQLVRRAVIGWPEILAHGATQWTDQDTQHRIHKKAIAERDAWLKVGHAWEARQAQEKADRNPDPETLMRRRYAQGAKWIGPLCAADGTVVIDPWKLTLLGPVGVSLDEAMAMLAEGRRRWKQPA